MDLKTVISVRPGDIVLYENGKADSGYLLRSSQHHTNEEISIFSGVEYIVSIVGGVAESGEQQFMHATKGKEFLELHTNNNTLVDAFIELEPFSHPLTYDFFSKNKKEDFPTKLEIEDFMEDDINEFIAPCEFLVELAKQAPKQNAYNISIDDYLWYVNMEINLAKNDHMEIYEEIFIDEKEEADAIDEDMPYTFGEGYAKFKEEHRQRKSFFEGVKNICEILTETYKLQTYGDVLKRITIGGVRMQDMQRFYEERWLAKKEFQNAAITGYEQIHHKMFKRYKW